MAIARTRSGYEVEVEASEVQIGQFIPIPWHIPEEAARVPKTWLQFLAQMYASKAHWGPYTLKKYKITDLAILPDYLFTMTDEQLWYFMSLLYSRDARLIKHHSGTSDSTIEVWVTFEHETQARGFQKLWTQLGVRTTVYRHPQLKKWLVRTSGIASYVKIRKMLWDTKIPKIRKRVRELDAVIPFELRIQDLASQALTDKVKEIIE